MFCIHCGARNPENASFCSTCGKAIGAGENTAAATEAAAPIYGGAESSRTTTHEVVAPVSAPAQTAPQLQTPYEAAAAGKGKPAWWVLAGFAACLLIVIAVAVGSRVSSSGSESARASMVPSSPPPDAAPAATPTADSTPAPNTAAPVENTPAAPSSEPVQAPQAPAPAPAPVPAPAPAAPQNSIVGDWKATTYIGSTIGLHLGADGRYILNPGSDEGVYAYSSGDGTLRLQSNSFFSNGIMVWSCQLFGDSLSCVDANGGGHVYSRVR